MVEISQGVLMTAVLTPAVGMAVFNLMAVVRGWLIPKATHDLQIKILTDRLSEVITEKNEWKTGAQSWEVVARKALDQVGDLVDSGKTSAYALDQIRIALERIGRRDKDGTS